MKKTVVTEKYNRRGNLVERVIVTEEEEQQAAPYLPTYPPQPLAPYPWQPAVIPITPYPWQSPLTIGGDPVTPYPWQNIGGGVVKTCVVNGGALLQ